MKNKKGMEAVLVTVIALMIVGVIIVMAATQGGSLVKTGGDVMDDLVVDFLGDDLENSNRTQELEERVKNLDDAALDGRLSDKQLEYGAKLTEHLFDHRDSNSTNGQLITFHLPSDETLDSNFRIFLLSLPTGVLIGYKDIEKNKTLRLVSPRTKSFEYLEGTDICVLPLSDEGSDAKKVLSYATGIQGSDLNGIASKEEILEIMNQHLVDQIPMSNTKIKYFFGDESDYDKNDEFYGVLAYNLNDILCIIPGTKWSIGSIKLKTQNQEKVLKGSGWIHDGLVASLFAQDLSIKQGDFK